MRRILTILLVFLIVPFVGCSISTHRSPGSAPSDPPPPRLVLETELYALHASVPDRAAEASERLEFAGARFEELFGAAPPKIAVVLFEHPAQIEAFDISEARGGGRLVLPWLSDDGVRAALPVLGDIAARRSLAMQGLPHEACHLFLIAYISGELGFEDPYERMRGLSADAYGDPLMPDWFDEAVATLCEEDDLRGERMAEMRGRLDDRIPLVTFFGREHPSRAGRAGDEAGDGAQAGERQPGFRIRIRRADTSDPTHELFYPQALSVALFLIEREGAGVIERLAHGFAAGESIDAILGGAANLPADIDQLERDWVEWVRAAER